MTAVTLVQPYNLAWDDWFKQRCAFLEPALQGASVDDADL